MNGGRFGALLRPSPRQTIAAAAELLARHQTGGGPVIIWQAIAEPLDRFDARVAAVRAATPGNLPVIAVEGGRRDMPQARGVIRTAMAVEHFHLLHPSRPSRYRCATGGRGSGKSHSVATAVVLLAATKRVRVLCAREIQRSLRESVHRLLEDRVVTLGLSRFFQITDNTITCTSTGSEIIFTGLYQNVAQIKSLEGLDLAWIEEAESVSARSLELLTPTVRRPGSEIWFSLNPDDPAAPVMNFAQNGRPGCRHVHTIYTDNPWCPAELAAEAEYLRAVDDDAYRHVWLGECRMASDAQVFAKKFVVEEFVAGGPGWHGPYYGADFGFARDPTTMVRCWIKGRELFVDYEAYGVGVDIDATPALFDTVPDARSYTVRCDSARPETISYLQRNGYSRAQAVLKWSGSVEDGVAHLRSYERIVVHPRCTHVADELRLYSYKVDRLSGDVLPDLVDRHNHCIDALRYALTPVISCRGGMGFIQFVEGEVEREREAKAQSS